MRGGVWFVQDFVRVDFFTFLVDCDFGNICLNHLHRIVSLKGRHVED